MTVTLPEVTKLYVATFNRAPDAAGINYWTNSGMSIENIAQSFFDQPETKALYDTLTSNTDFVNAIYNNLFNRNAEQAGLEYWVSQLDAGNVSRNTAILAFINGAEANTSAQGILDSTILTHKQTVGLSFVQHGLEDVNLARSVIEGIDASESSVEQALLNIDDVAPITSLSVVSANDEGLPSRGEANDISSDGRYIVFESVSRDLVTQDVGYYGNIYRKDMVTGEVDIVSTNSSGIAANGSSNTAKMSDDGRYIVFHSSAYNLVDNDNNGATDIFLKDMQTGALTLVSTTSLGIQGNGASEYASISADGNSISFMSYATNLVGEDTNNKADTFVKNLQTGSITRISENALGVGGDGDSYGGVAFSTDGRYAVFNSDATNLIEGDTNGVSDIFMKDMQTGTIARLSTAADGTQGNGESISASVSADGRYVAFMSYASNLAQTQGGDDRTMQIYDIFVKDTQTGSISVATTTSSGLLTTYGGYFPSLSSDGRYVVFESGSTDLVSDDTNFVRDIFIKDLQSGMVSRLSLNTSGVEGNYESSEPYISADGTYVTFSSWSTNFASNDTNGYPDAFRIGNPFVAAQASIDAVQLIGTDLASEFLLI